MSLVTNYLIVHGTESSPQENWFPWLKTKLELNGAKVFAPCFPTPENQTLENWMRIADAALKDCVPSNTVLIGHSTGAVFVLRMAERTQQPYKGIFSVCPFMCDLGQPQFDPLNSSFVKPPFDGNRAQHGAQKTTCFAGNNDPYVPLAYSSQIAEKVGADLVVITNGGHLNAAANYLEFPLLLQRIQELS